MSSKIDISKIENLESMVFAVLTRQKIVLVGDKNDADKFYSDLDVFIPDDLKNQITYGTNDNSLSKDLVVSFLEMNESSMKFLDRTMGQYTVVFLPSMQVYGQYTSPFCKNLVNLLKTSKLDSLKEELNIFYNEAIESDDLMTPADYAAKKQKHKADASLLLWVRALYFNKEVESTIINTGDW